MGDNNFPVNTTISVHEEFVNNRVIWEQYHWGTANRLLLNVLNETNY